MGREKGSGTREQYESFFAEQNIRLDKINTHANFDNMQSIINAAISGLGIAVVSEFAARTFIKQKMILPERKFYYVLKKGFAKSHLIDLFIEFLLDEHRP